MLKKLWREAVGDQSPVTLTPAAARQVKRDLCASGFGREGALMVSLEKNLSGEFSINMKNVIASDYAPTSVFRSRGVRVVISEADRPCLSETRIDYQSKHSYATGFVIHGPRVAAAERAAHHRWRESIDSENHRPESLPKNDEARRLALLARINRNGDINSEGVSSPLLSLEEFFMGNNDYGSIGYNFYPDQPAPAEFYDRFGKIRDRRNVHDVLVEVKDLEDPDGWPAADTIWVITAASGSTVCAWLGDRFRPDDVIDGFPSDGSVETYDLPAGMRAVGIWWD